jgi:hypothetical protein
MRIVLTLFFFTIYSFCTAQVTGGESIYQFLRLSNSAHATGMGGMIVSNPSEDVAFAFANPALLRPSLHNQLSINQNFFITGSSYSNTMYASYSPKLKTTFAGGISYMNHGKITATNYFGQTLNNVMATEICAQISASKSYKKKWRGGASLKFVNSQLADLQSAGLMADAGVIYFDTAKQLYIGMLAKNIGFQFNKYSTQSGSEPLPFDMQLGISKKFLKAPFRLNAIVHHLYQWDIRYDNPADKVDNSFFGNTDTAVNTYFADKLFRHFNFGVDLLLGKRLELNVGYSHQRRGELALKEKLGMAGFSFGVGLNFPKFNLHYGRNVYNLAGTNNEIGINFKMKEMFGLGKSAIGDW